MAIDKTRNLAGLLMACHLNILRVRDEITYRRFYGDKESYWLGHALTSTPYHFVPGYSGGIGRITHPKDGDGDETEREETEREEICTLQLLHVLESTKEPFWFNNGIVEFKGANDDKYIVPTGWVGHEGRWSGGGKRFPNELCISMPETWKDHLLGKPDPVYRVEGLLKWRLERMIQEVAGFDNMMERQGLIKISH
jgi:hypothetical protein